ncbi:MAG: hypothetical protein H7061_07290 [Bdellovibrionaceae bacterium]|nr:hypothetical protein [Bdellovibrio sp.]
MKLKDLKLKRRYKYALLFLLLLIGATSFQNCSPKPFQSGTVTSSSTAKNSTSITPNLNNLPIVYPPPAPVAPTPVAPTPSPAPTPTPTPAPAPTPTPTPNPTNGINYFGFFADGMEHEGTGNYINETSPVANLHFVNADTLEGLTVKIKQAVSKNSKVIIIAEGYLFDWQTVKLQANYKSNILNLRNHLASNNLLSAVVGFYMIDEPYFKNSVATNQISEQEVFNNLRSAAIEVTNNFGNTAIVSTEAFPTLDKFMSTGQWLGFPTEYNWLAFNCYLTYGLTCSTEQKYSNYITAFRSKMSGNQRLFLTLDNYTNINPVASMQAQLIARSQFQHQLALQYNAVALVSFMYQGASDRLGVQNMPELRNYVFNLASSITGKSSGAATTPTPTPAAGGCTDLEPRCEGADSVRRNSCGDVTGRWVMAPICTRTTCEGADFVRRDSDNKVIEVWANAPDCR